MTTHQFFLLLALVPATMRVFAQTLEKHPTYSLGDAVQYHYTTAAILCFLICAFFFLLYYVIVKRTKIVRRVMVIAYARFFTGIKKNRVIYDWLLCLVLLFSFTYIVIPANQCFRLTNEGDDDSLSYNTYKRYAKKFIKKKDLDVFYEFLKEHYRYDFLNSIPYSIQQLQMERTYDAFDHISGEDERFTRDFVSANTFYNLIYSQFYLFSDLFVKNGLREAIYDIHPDPDSLFTAPEVNTMIDEFFEDEVYPYVSRKTFWIPSVANAVRYMLGPQLAADVKFLHSNVPYNLKVLSMYQAGHRLPSRNYVFGLPQRKLRGKKLKKSKEWLAAGHSLPYYQEIAHAMKMVRSRYPTNFDVGTWSIKESLRVHGFISKAYTRLEKLYPKGLDIRIKMLRPWIKGFALTGTGSTIDQEWEDSEETYYYGHVEPFEAKNYNVDYYPKFPFAKFDARHPGIPKWFQPEIEDNFLEEYGAAIALYNENNQNNILDYDPYNPYDRRNPFFTSEPSYKYEPPSVRLFSPKSKPSNTSIYVMAKTPLEESEEYRDFEEALDVDVRSISTGSLPRPAVSRSNEVVYLPQLADEVKPPEKKSKTESTSSDPLYNPPVSREDAEARAAIAAARATSEDATSGDAASAAAFAREDAAARAAIAEARAADASAAAFAREDAEARAAFAREDAAARAAIAEARAADASAEDAAARAARVAAARAARADAFAREYAAINAAAAAREDAFVREARALAETAALTARVAEARAFRDDDFVRADAAARAAIAEARAADARAARADAAASAAAAAAREDAAARAAIAEARAARAAREDDAARAAIAEARAALAAARAARAAREDAAREAEARADAASSSSSFMPYDDYSSPYIHNPQGLTDKQIAQLRTSSTSILDGAIPDGPYFSTPSYLTNLLNQEEAEEEAETYYTKPMNATLQDLAFMTDAEFAEYNAMHDFDQEVRENPVKIEEKLGRTPPPSYRNVPTLYKLLKRYYYPEFKHEVEHGTYLSAFINRNEFHDFVRLSSFLERYSYFYFTTFWFSTLRAAASDKYRFLNDFDLPQNQIIHKDFYKFFEDDEWFRIKAVSVFHEWPRMADSLYSYQLTKFSELEEFPSIYSVDKSEQEISSFSPSLFDFAHAGQMGFQNSAGPSMEGIIDLHHDLMFFLITIVVFVMWLLVSVVQNYYLMDERGEEITSVSLIPSLKSHNVKLETVWSISPACVLVAVSMPSFALIYELDDVLTPGLTLRVIGHQWYWSYEYTNIATGVEPSDCARDFAEVFKVSPDFLEKYFNSSERKVMYLNAIISSHLCRGSNILTKFNVKDDRVSLIQAVESITFSVRRAILLHTTATRLANEDMVRGTFSKRLEPYINSSNQKAIYWKIQGSKHFGKPLQKLFFFHAYKGLLSKHSNLLAFYASQNEIISLKEGFLFLVKKYYGPHVTKYTKGSARYAKELDSWKSQRKAMFSAYKTILNNYSYRMQLCKIYDVTPFQLKMVYMPTFGLNLLVSVKPDFFYTTVMHEKIIESRMVLDPELVKGQLRLLSVSNRVILPVETDIRVVVTSTDVLHSWAVPALGFKLDACPGRLNQAPLYIKRTGVFYGQCSELCGVGHAFMPIVIEAISCDSFEKWINDHSTVRTISANL